MGPLPPAGAEGSRPELLARWLATCESRGLPVSLREHLSCRWLQWQMQRRGEWPSDEGEQLRLWGPIVCHRPEHQADYERWVQLHEAQRPGPGPELSRARSSAAGAPASAHRSRRIAAWSLAAFVAVLVAGGVWFGASRPVPTAPGAASAPLPPVLAASGGLQVDSPSPTPAAAASAPADARTVFVPQQPFAERQPVEPAWPAVLRLAACALAAVSLAFTLWRLWRQWRRSRLFVEAGQAPEDAVEQHLLRGERQTPPAARHAVLLPASRLMRQRVVGETSQLDPRATVAASIRAGGLLQPRFSLRTHTPEYLALVDRGGDADHQARYHEALIQALVQRGVSIELFYYRDTPAEGCWRLRDAPQATADGLPVERDAPQRVPHDRQRFETLLARYPQHRLMVFGDARAAVQQQTGQPSAWALLARRMPQRAWFTPLPLASWGTVETWVTSDDGLDFLLLPMEEGALQAMAGWLASGRVSWTADERLHRTYPSLLQADPMAWVDRPVPPAEAVQERLVQELRAYLGPHAVWLSACAIFPALAWPLTLRLGRALQSSAPADLAAPLDDSALALGAAALGGLPWFRVGRMPDWLRTRLLDELPETLRDSLRADLLRGLEQGLGPGADTEAVARVAQRKWLPALLRSARGPLADVLLLRFLEPALAPKLASRLPDAVRRLLFPGGAVLRGLKPGVAWAAAVPMLLGVLAIPAVWQPLSPGPRWPVEPLSSVEGLPGAGVTAAIWSPAGGVTAWGRLAPLTIQPGDAGPAAQPVALTAEAVELVAATGWPAAAVRTADGRAWAWRHGTGGPVAPIDLGEATAVAIHPLGTAVLRGTAQGELVRHSLLGLPTVTLVPAEASPAPVTAVALHPGDERVASVRQGQPVEVWRVDRLLTGAARRTALPQTGATALAFSPDGQTLVVGTESGGVALWDPVAARRVAAWVPWPEHPSVAIRRLAFSVDGTRLAAGYADGRIAVWAMSTGDQIAQLDTGEAPRQLQFSADGSGLRGVRGGSQTAWAWGALEAATLAVVGCTPKLPDAVGAVDIAARETAERLASGLTAATRRTFAVMPPDLWLAWGHGRGPLPARTVLVPLGQESQAAQLVTLLQASAVTPAASAAASAGSSVVANSTGWGVVARADVRTVTVNACGVQPPDPDEDLLPAVAWPGAPADAVRQQRLREALASLWQPDRAARPAVLQRLLSDGELLSDLLPLALTQVHIVVSGKDGDSDDAQSRIGLVLKLAESATPVTLQRHSADVQALMRAARKVGEGMEPQIDATKRALLAAKGLKPELVITLEAAPESRTQQSPLLKAPDPRDALVPQLSRIWQQMGGAPPRVVRARAAGAGGRTPAETRLDALGRTDQALARWLTQRLVSLPGLGDASLRQVGAAAQDAGSDRYALIVKPPLPDLVQPRLLDLTRFRDCDDDAVCPWMVVIPRGSFMMGSPAGERGRFVNEGPQRRVTIGQRFALMETEVTRRHFEAFVKETGDRPVNKGCDWQRPGFDQSPSHPVVCVSHDDALAFAQWLSKKTKQTYRLPTEAEWEYAARGGNPSAYSFGDDESQLCRFANTLGVQSQFPCLDHYDRTAPVGSFERNLFDLYDMHGNVWEWVQDCWHDDYRGAPPSDGTVWTVDCNGEGRRVMRGGGWGNSAAFARSSFREAAAADRAVSNLGFRLARTLPP